MNQRIWSGLTVTLLTTALGTVISSPAQQAQAVDQGSERNPSAIQVQQQLPATDSSALQPAPAQPGEAVKVGELQSQTAKAAEEQEIIAKIHAYELEGRQAATLYVRSIPVLTFLGAPTEIANGTKMGEAVVDSPPIAQANRQKMAASHQGTPDSTMSGAANEQAKPSTDAAANDADDDAVWRATTVAARLNQLNRENLDAEAIAVRWNAECNCYSININSEELVKIDQDTILPDTTENLAEDALQATNRLRRLMGNAPPLREIIGRPLERKVTQVSIGPVRIQISGIASWYGPGFHGNRSASGEIYNQNAMTAAHRSLPFGTNVQVTNLNNGRSVVVRINDRGPYVRGRVIDLSAAAARTLGILHTGTAPVRIDVLGNP
ncbi:MAG TPA: septal ring lytic transglycosylase RlpA family protein [Cyanobacteria bacterium UBA8803]|nr:septal ring lytic transglycosylase RlpA family protein [Cyanobacteria bacterium UBA9273]HBL62015.1 septal ring lytic transglycosylase RlpA family protein [Cyanobacteria bacterium UBA8803]